MNEKSFTKGLKNRWLKALRSGAYAQGKFALCEIDQDGAAYYCSLGVLAEVREGEGTWYGQGKYLSPKKGSYLWYGGDLLGVDNATSLAQMNDRGDTFDIIAEYIEKHIPASNE